MLNWKIGIIIILAVAIIVGAVMAGRSDVTKKNNQDGFYKNEMVDSNIDNKEGMSNDQDINRIDVELEALNDDLLNAEAGLNDQSIEQE